MKILALIPARGGSRGIPRKNIRLFAGRPLIAWTIEAAINAKGIAETVVSTEDEEIAKVARNFGANVPFMRPETLARDDTPSMAVLLHAVEQLPGFDWVMLLQPTSPLRTRADIEGIIELCCNQNAASAVSVSRVKQHPNWMFKLKENRSLQSFTAHDPKVDRRQDLIELFSLNGALYLARVDELLKNNGFISDKTLGYVMPINRSVDIDEIEDWQIAECFKRQEGQYFPGLS